MACNSCNNYGSNVAGIWFPDFVSNSCCNPCCRGNVGGTSNNNCGCGNVGGTSNNNCGCGNVGGTSNNNCGNVGGTNTNNCCCCRCCRYRCGNN